MDHDANRFHLDAATGTNYVQAAIPGLGKARLERVEQQLDRLRAADAPQRRREQLELQKSQPGYCPECGQPRADHVRNIVTGRGGQLRSVAAFSDPGPYPEPCDDCQEHHRGVLGMVVTA